MREREIGDSMPWPDEAAGLPAARRGKPSVRWPGRVVREVGLRTLDFSGKWR